MTHALATYLVLWILIVLLTIGVFAIIRWFKQDL